MAVHKVVVIRCNGCGTTSLPPGLTIGDLVHMMYPPPHDVTGARNSAAIKGWRHTASGKDLCPACQSTKRAPAKSRLLGHIPHPHLPHWGTR